MTLAPWLFLDLGRVEQSGDEGRRADADRDTRFDKLGTALFVGPIGLVVAVAHRALSMAASAALEVA